MVLNFSMDRVVTIALMESSNKTMTNEKSKWTKLENKYSAACDQLQQRQDLYAKPAPLDVRRTI